jgi:hypothetical protein
VVKKSIGRSRSLQAGKLRGDRPARRPNRIGSGAGAEVTIFETCRHLPDGAHHYGARTKIVESETWNGTAYDTCRWASLVSRKFDTYRRREVLSFEHHKTLAARNPEIADSLLDWCEAPLKGHGRNGLVTGRSRPCASFKGQPVEGYKRAFSLQP